MTNTPPNGKGDIHWQEVEPTPGATHTWVLVDADGKPYDGELEDADYDY